MHLDRANCLDFIIIFTQLSGKLLTNSTIWTPISDPHLSQTKKVMLSSGCNISMMSSVAPQFTRITWRICSGQQNGINGVKCQWTCV